MTSQVSFYLLENKQASATQPHAEQAVLIAACQQASQFYRQQQKVFIFTENQAQGELIDELLWSFEADSFVAHNLPGEGPNYGSPVEISWFEPKNRRPILINLTSTVPHFAHKFSHIVDFVPTDETLKQQARERFKQYRQAQFVIETKPWPVNAISV
jgi:DNA polymerase-3 subunit chi